MKRTASPASTRVGFLARLDALVRELAPDCERRQQLRLPDLPVAIHVALDEDVIELHTLERSVQRAGEQRAKSKEQGAKSKEQRARSMERGARSEERRARRQGAKKSRERRAGRQGAKSKERGAKSREQGAGSREQGAKSEERRGKSARG